MIALKGSAVPPTASLYLFAGTTESKKDNYATMVMVGVAHLTVSLIPTSNVQVLLQSARIAAMEWSRVLKHAIIVEGKAVALDVLLILVISAQGLLLFAFMCLIVTTELEKLVKTAITDQVLVLMVVTTVVRLNADTTVTEI